MNEIAYQLRAALPGFAERTQAQLLELHRETSAERAFIAARAAAEVVATLVRLGAELERGESKAA